MADLKFARGWRGVWFYTPYRWTAYFGCSGWIKLSPAWLHERWRYERLRHRLMREDEMLRQSRR